MQPNAPQGLVGVEELILNWCDFFSAWKDTGVAGSILGHPSSDSSGFPKEEKCFMEIGYLLCKTVMGSTLVLQWELKIKIFSHQLWVLKRLSICKAERVSFCNQFYLWFLPVIDLNPDSIKDLRDLIKDSSLVDWKHKFRLIFF